MPNNKNSNSLLLLIAITPPEWDHRCTWCSFDGDHDKQWYWKTSRTGRDWWRVAEAMQFYYGSCRESTPLSRLPRCNNVGLKNQYTIEYSYVITSNYHEKLTCTKKAWMKYSSWEKWYHQSYRNKSSTLLGVALVKPTTSYFWFHRNFSSQPDLWSCCHLQKLFFGCLPILLNIIPNLRAVPKCQ